MSNYDADDVARLNDWACRADAVRGGLTLSPSTTTNLLDAIHVDPSGTIKLSNLPTFDATSLALHVS